MTDPLSLAKDKQYKVLIIVVVALVVVILGYVIWKAAKAGGSILDAIKNLFGGVSGGITGITDAVGITTSDTQKAADATSIDPGSPWHAAFLNNVPTSVAFSVGGQQDYDQIASDIYNAFGIFNDDAETVIAAFQKLTTKAQLAQLVIVFMSEYNSDLLTFIRGGGGALPWDGLSDAHLNVILNYVNSLPKY